MEGGFVEGGFGLSASENPARMLKSNKINSKHTTILYNYYNIFFSLVTKRSEVIMLSVNYKDDRPNRIGLTCSEKHDDYEVLQTLRAEFNFEGNNGKYIHDGSFPAHNQREIEMILRSFGFVQESYDDNYYERDSLRVKCWKFVRTVSK
ncbi:hypothetical protein Ddc_24879 [Ditylenchus destructor]|nr:hypothetical protein Ddc_24879 [Ditylenchus destructor]